MNPKFILNMHDLRGAHTKRKWLLRKYLVDTFSAEVSLGIYTLLVVKIKKQTVSNFVGGGGVLSYHTCDNSVIWYDGVCNFITSYIWHVP